MKDKPNSTRRDDRSPEVIAARKLYKTKKWQITRQNQLNKQPLCERCQDEDKVTAATIVHHRKPHKGLPVLFFDPLNLESLCKPHHDSQAQQQERIGYSKDTGPDGMPIDPNHPFYMG